MSVVKNKDIKDLHSLLDIAQMKFRPDKVIHKQASNNQGSLITRIQSALSIKSTSSIDGLQNEEAPDNRLKFIEKLSGEYFIVGNENQIDMISFGG